MNGKVSKRLRQLVKNLPQSIEERHIFGTVKGSKLTEEQRNALGEKHIFSVTNNYRVTKIKLVDMDHGKKIKPFYTKYGIEKCLEKYLEWFFPYQEKMIAKYPQAVVKEEQNETIDA